MFRKVNGIPPTDTLNAALSKAKEKKRVDEAFKLLRLYSSLKPEEKHQFEQAFQAFVKEYGL